MQKIKPVINNSEESSEALAKHLKPDHKPDHVGGISEFGEASRRVRSSAAMLAAISMGAAGVLLPNQSDEAKASEINNLNLTSLPTPSETTSNSLELASNYSEPLPEVPRQITELPAPPAIKHKVQQGDTLWELSENYKVQPDIIAASNELESRSILSVGQTLDIPPVRESEASISQEQGIPPLLPSAESSNSSEGYADELLKNKQEVALQDLKKQRQRLKNQLQQLQAPTDSLNVEETIALQEPTVESSESTAFVPSKPQTVVSSEFKLDPSQDYQTPASTSVASSPSLPPEETVPFPLVSPVPLEYSSEIPTLDIVEETATLPEHWIDSSQSSMTPSVEPLTIPQETSTSIDESTYRVQPGDTLDSIAKRHGVSRAEIAKANGIYNPHLIIVNQALAIPQPRTDANSTLLPGVEMIQEQTRNEIEQPTLLTLPLSESQTEFSSSLEIADSSVAETTTFSVRNSPQSEVAVTSPQTNPYVDRLKLEIDQMRQEMRARSSGTLEMTTETDPSSVRHDSQDSETPVLNPEWQIDQQVIQTVPEFESVEDQPLVIESQNTQSDHSATEPTLSPQLKEPEELVAVAPVPVETYNSELQVPVGQQVAPELPSLSEPDDHLPDAPQPFTGYTWPAKGVLTSGYGWRWGRMHKGIDIAAPIGTPIVAAGAGEIISAGWNSGGYGNLVKIKHPDGSITLYAHNNRILVSRGQYVNQGEQIAEMGSTGYSTGPHLHFEIHTSDKGVVNPVAHLPGR